MVHLMFFRVDWCASGVVVHESGLRQKQKKVAQIEDRVGPAWATGATQASFAVDDALLRFFWFPLLRGKFEDRVMATREHLGTPIIARSRSLGLPIYRSLGLPIYLSPSPSWARTRSLSRSLCVCLAVSLFSLCLFLSVS